VEPADYKRYVLPIIFLRFLSLRYDRRRAELEALVADKNSDYYGDKRAIRDPDEYRRVAAFVIPEAARWENIRKAAQADDIKVKLDDVLESLENEYPDTLKGLLPRIYAGSNMDAVSVRGLINLFSKDLFEADHGGEDLIGRVYEYFIGEFASSEGKRGGEYFTPVSIVVTALVYVVSEPIRIRKPQWRRMLWYPPTWLAIPLAWALAAASERLPPRFRPHSSGPDWQDVYTVVPIALAITLGVVARQLPWHRVTTVTALRSRKEGTGFTWTEIEAWITAGERPLVGGERDLFQHHRIADRIARSVAVERRHGDWWRTVRPNVRWGSACWRGYQVESTRSARRFVPDEAAGPADI
jgi:hypothetical protein